MARRAGTSGLRSPANTRRSKSRNCSPLSGSNPWLVVQALACQRSVESPVSWDGLKPALRTEENSESGSFAFATWIGSADEHSRIRIERDRLGRPHRINHFQPVSTLGKISPHFGRHSFLDAQLVWHPLMVKAGPPQ